MGKFIIMGLLCGPFFIILGVIGMNLKLPGCEIVNVCIGDNTCMVDPGLCDSYRYDEIYHNNTMNCRKEFHRSILLFTEHNVDQLTCSGSKCTLLEGCYKYEYRQNLILIEKHEFIKNKDERYSIIGYIKRISILVLFAGIFFLIITCISMKIKSVNNRVHPVR